MVSVAEPALNNAGDAALLTVFPRSSPQAEETAGLVGQLRDETIPGAVEGTRTEALVGGYTARLVDEADRISARLPIFALAVVGLSLLLLAMTFRSFKVAVLSALFNAACFADSVTKYLLNASYSGESSSPLALSSSSRALVS